jgi:PBSX family phage terminase large subunit
MDETSGSTIQPNINHTKPENFNLHPAQMKIVNDRHRYKVICAGRRFGKSVYVAWEMFAMAVANENARIPYYAPTRDDARDIMWKTLKDICGPLIVGEPNESRLEINVRNRFGGTSLIVLYGWEAVQERGKGVGVRNNHIFLDEVSKYKNFKYGWEEILSPTLLDLKGGATFISTPNGFNHFYDLTLMPNKSNEWVYFHFTSYDNPFNDPNEINKKKNDITEERFAQEYLGEFKKKSGLVYKEFNRDTHILQELPEELEVVYTLGGIDWGHTHPCAVLTIKKGYNGNYYVTDEFYKTGLTEEDVIDYTVGQKFNKVFPDSENASGVAGLKRRGVNVKEVRKGKGSIVSGISKVQELLKQNRLYILKKCVNTIQEFESYSYKEDKDETPDENPEKENDDAMDALRYVIMSDIDNPGSSGVVKSYGTATAYGNRINMNKFNK